ncbi:hypothetical protein JTB14_012748 [Gonioctena quinquepunctata]|nr:hypothetical protein JTB14_012748 [Gonioctena quinquepunctata]
MSEHKKGGFYCVVRKCHNRTMDKIITFFRLPKDSERARFRLSKDTVELIIEEIREAISCIRYEVNILTNEEKVLITLRSTLGSTLQDVGDFTGIDR